MPDAHFYLHHHPKQEVLADLLLSKLQAEGSGEPFHQSTVLVRNQGMGTWLQRRIAQKHQICMGITFPQPNRFLQDILQAGSIDPEYLKWQIYQKLPKLSNRSSFQAIQRYLESDDNQQASCLKRYQLAGVLAGLFDKYLLYRPDWIKQWQGNHSIDLPSNANDESWQRELWQAAAPEAETHWSQILLGDTPLPAPNPEITSLHVFGITNFAPAYTRFLNKLSNHIPVHIYWMNPVEKDGGYWEDSATRKDWLLAKEFDDPDILKHNNPLLSSFGRLGREFIHTIYGGATEEIHVQEENHHLPPASPDSANSHLERLQSSLYQNTTNAPSQDVDEADPSIAIHACHSPLRELETLKTYLLTLAESSPIDPGDVLVMCPDIQTYAPAIEAVFGKHHNQDLPYLPFSIGDHGQPDADPSITALLSLFSLHHSRFTNQEALKLLATPSILEHFELTEDDIPTIKDWVQQNGIRWGFNKQHIQQTTPGCPESSWSWQSGIDRMLLGYAMPNSPGSGSPVLWDHITPFHHIEGSNTRILDGLCNFLDWCRKIRQTLKSERSLSSWVKLTREWIDSGTSKSDVHQRTLRPLDSALDTILQQAGDMNEKVPSEVMLEHLTQTLQNTPTYGGFLNGSVTFCEMKPMRAIPARIICLLGMNHDSFPRPASETPFDLTRQQRRMGDRSSRDDDTYAFLEALLSARENLFISYIGISIKDGKPRPPSTALQTLLDNLPGLRTKTEKLHNFDPAYFQAEPPSSAPISHDKKLLDCARLLIANNDNSTTEPPVCDISIDTPPLSETITLDQFVNTITHPVKQFLHHTLQAQSSYLAPPLDPDEPITTDGLAKYKIKQSILSNKILNDGNIEAWQQTSMLPPPPLSSRSEFEPIAEIAEEIPNTVPLEINITLQTKDQKLNITGTVPLNANGETPTIISSSPSEVNARQILTSWLYLLAASIQRQEPVQAQLHGIKDMKPDVQYLMPSDDPKTILQDLTELYQKAQQKPVPHFPNTAHAYVTEKQKASDDDTQHENKRRKKALAKWLRTPGRKFSNAESEDEANRYFFIAESLFSDSELTDEFTSIAHLIWDPIQNKLSNRPS